MCAVACLSSCGCPDKNVIETHKCTYINKKDSTKNETFQREHKWHVRDGQVFECIKGEDKPSTSQYINGKFVYESEDAIMISE